jgi:hypothetical protein
MGCVPDHRLSHGHCILTGYMGCGRATPTRWPTRR